MLTLQSPVNYSFLECTTGNIKFRLQFIHFVFHAFTDPAIVLSMFMLSFTDPAIVLSMFMLSFTDPAIVLSMFMLSFTGPAIVLSMFMLSFIFMISCGLFSRNDYVQVCIVCFNLYCSCRSIYQLKEEEFEDTKCVFRITDNTIANRKRTNGQTSIYKTYT